MGPRERREQTPRRLTAVDQREAAGEGGAVAFENAFR